MTSMSSAFRKGTIGRLLLPLLSSLFLFLQPLLFTFLTLLERIPIVHRFVFPALAFRCTSQITPAITIVSFYLLPTLTPVVKGFVYAHVEIKIRRALKELAQEVMLR